MKRTVLSLGLIAIAIMVGLSACNKDGGPWGPEDDGMMMVSQVLPDEYIPSFDASEFTVEGSLDANDMECYPEFNGNGNDNRNNDRGIGNMRDKMAKRMGPGFELRKLFWLLKLDRTQAAEVSEVMTAYHDCVQTVMMATEEERRAIMETARASRIEIMTKYRENGDREAAQIALRELYAQVKADLDALIDHDALCDCYNKMLEGIKLILTDDQLAIYERWLKTVKNPCLENPGERE